jgi:hypothetical protein
LTGQRRTRIVSRDFERSDARLALGRASPLGGCVIPAAPFDALQQLAEARSSARHAGEYMSEIQTLLAEELPQVEAALSAATSGPVPVEQSAVQLVMAGGKRVRPLSALLVERVCGALRLRPSHRRRPRCSTTM